MPGSGWGGAPWGGSGWGSPPSATPLQLLTALSIAENLVLLTFNQDVYFSGLLDPTDASQPGLFTFTPVTSGPLGQDGTVARPVGSASVVQNTDADGSVVPTQLLVTLDRPMTPSPALYVVVASSTLQTADQSQTLSPSASTAQFGAVFKRIVVPTLDTPTSVATADIASPVDRSSAVAANAPFPSNLFTLGVPIVDASGDYATDRGLVNLKKRVLRRILFVPGSTVFLRNYGAGALTYGKKLASAANRAALAAACEAQIALEPDVAAVSVQTQFSSQYPGLFYLVVLVRSSVTGQGSFKLLVPVTSTSATLPPVGIAA